MGLLGTIKGWLNIGGVKVKIQDFNPAVSKCGNQIKGKVLLTSKGDKQVRKVAYKFLLTKTSGRGNDRETKEYILAQSVANEPFALKTGEEKMLDFQINYSLEKSLKDMGGVLGAVGKLGAFAAKEKLEYSVVAQCDVQGAAFGPKDKVAVRIVD